MTISLKFPKLKTILIISISIIIIFSCAYFKSIKEGLTNNNTLILMGDSILNNANYVPEGTSVYAFLKQKVSNVINVAKDGATINDLYAQLDKIPIELNNSQTYIFISAGGNNILSNSTTKLNKDQIIQLFNTYIDFLKALRAKLSNVKINILNLYLPTNPRYQSYKSSVDQWNQLLKEYSNKIGETYNILDLHTLLTSPEDFIYDIEPSKTASDKIAYLIYLTR
jgi:molybdopterin converting factor small subunit